MLVDHLIASLAGCRADEVSNEKDSNRRLQKPIRWDERPACQKSVCIDHVLCLIYYSSIMYKTSIMRAVFLLAICCLLPAALLANKKPPETPVNLNTATSEQLQ